MRRVIPFLIMMVATSASAYIVPVQTAGEYNFKVAPSDPVDENGLPTSHPTESIGIVDEATGAILACGDLPEGHSFTVDNPLVIRGTVPAPTDGSGRVAIRAVAYDTVGCVGEASPNSVEVGLIFFLGPQRPVLVP